MPHTNRNHRHKRPKLPRKGRTLQAGDGVGHRDTVIQAKKWKLFGTASFSNATTNFSYGLRNINISTTNAGVASAVYNRLMQGAAQSYEEYRVRRVTIYAQPGIGYTNDDRIKSSIFARVDTNSQPTSPTLNNLNSLICSESSVNRTFTERSNVKLVDYHPVCYSSGGSGASSRPILKPSLQWYNIEERDAHIWRGATVAPILTDPSIDLNSKGITVWCDIEMDFRSRKPEFESVQIDSVEEQD